MVVKEGMFFNETGYLIPLVETVGVNQQGKRAIALAPCFLAPTVSTRGIKYPCFILTMYLMHFSTNQRRNLVSLLKTLTGVRVENFDRKQQGTGSTNKNPCFISSTLLLLCFYLL